MVTVTAARVLAHQGGWDEILFVLAPLAVLAGLLALARRRVGDVAAVEIDGDPPGKDPAGTDRG